MKKLFKISIALIFSLSLLNISNAMAITQTFPGTSVSDLITEAGGTYTSSINYTPFWTPGLVTSATLTLFLSDDASTILNPFNAIDIPREWAQVSNIRDGGLNMVGSKFFEVEHTSPLFNLASVGPFNTVFPGSEGFENPLTTRPITNAALFAAATTGAGIIHPSAMSYDIDVTSFMNSVGLGGTLEFDLTALNLYGTVPLPPDFLAAVAPFGFNPLDPQTTFEDYLFKGAQLTVSAVPEPSMYFMLALGLFGMFMSRRWLHRNN